MSWHAVSNGSSVLVPTWHSFSSRWHLGTTCFSRRVVTRHPLDLGGLLPPAEMIQDEDPFVLHGVTLPPFWGSATNQMSIANMPGLSLLKSYAYASQALDSNVHPLTF